MPASRTTRSLPSRPKTLSSTAITEAKEIPSHRLVMLRRFFQDYKQLEGKAVEVDEIRPAAEGLPIITDALHRYSDQRRKGFKELQGKH
jgi:inorganic pyrophosphatase